MAINFPGGRTFPAQNQDMSAARDAMQGVFNDLRSGSAGVISDISPSASAIDAMRRGFAYKPTQPAMSPIDAMRASVTYQNPRPTVSPFDAMRGSVGSPSATGAMPGTDAQALGYAFNGGDSQTAQKETALEQARRIMQGGAGQRTTGNINTDNAMAVDAMRQGTAARRDYSMNVLPNLPTDSDSPEVAATKQHYLELLTLRGAGSPLAATFDQPGGSTVDQRAAAVRAMANSGVSLAGDPAERNRRALVEAMKSVQSEDPSDPTKTISRSMTAEEAMTSYLNAGGQPNAAVDSILKSRSDRGNYSSIDAAVKKAQALAKTGIQGVRVVTKPGGTYDLEVHPSSGDASSKVQAALDVAQEELTEAQSGGDQAAIADAQARVQHYSDRMSRLTQGKGGVAALLSPNLEAGSTAAATAADRSTLPTFGAEYEGRQVKGPDGRSYLVKGGVPIAIK